jgi:hypothetical protein
MWLNRSPRIFLFQFNIFPPKPAEGEPLVSGVTFAAFCASKKLRKKDAPAAGWYIVFRGSFFCSQIIPPWIIARRAPSMARSLLSAFSYSNIRTAPYVDGLITHFFKEVPLRHQQIPP